MKLLIGCYNKSVILTHIGILAALAGMALVQNHDIGVLCLIIAGICDLFDGAVARRCKRDEKEKAFGVQLDSLADLISFGAFPFVFLWEITPDSAAFKIPAAIAGVLYVLAAVTRLGWFNITTEENRGFYRGMPVTYSALIIAVIYPLSYLLDTGVTAALYIGVYFIMAVLFVLNFKVGKPKKPAYIAFCLLAVAVAAVVLLHLCGVLV